MITLGGLINLSHEYHEQNRLLKLSKYGSSMGHVLMFHHVTDQDINAPAICKSSIDEFVNTIENYRNNDYAFMDLETAISFIRNDKSGKFAVLTFDDIPDDVYNNAYPILKRLRIPFAVFISLGFINKQGYITKNQLLELSMDPLCTIGAHSMTHTNLGTIEDSTWEISQSKIELEMIIGKQVRYFAYPYGSKDAVPLRARQAARDAGFEAAFCAVPAPLTKGVFKEDPWYLPRVVPQKCKIYSFYKKTIVKETIRKFFKR